MRLTKHSPLLISVLIALQFVAESSNAFVMPPPANWVFQNTEATTATDITMSIETFRGNHDLVIDPDPAHASGGPLFPTLGTHDIHSIQFVGPPGLASQGFIGLSFVGYPSLTKFNVTFSYGEDHSIVRQPGRVFAQVAGLDFKFEFVPDLSSEPFAELPANFDFLSSRVQIFAAPEPSSIILFGTGAISLIGFAWRRKQSLVRH